MIDEKIYTQEDLNNAVANAIKDMSTVLETKDKELKTLKIAFNAITNGFVPVVGDYKVNNGKYRRITREQVKDLYMQMAKIEMEANENE